ncbi:MAG: hypothetical protein V4622_01100 [Bacteroidota bacterium]
MKFIFCILFFFLFSSLFAQESNQRELKIKASSKEVFLDSLTIYPNSLKVFCGDEILTLNDYKVNYTTSKFTLLKLCQDSILIRFRVFPMNLSKNYQSRDTAQIYSQHKGDRDKFLIQSTDSYADIFGTSSIKKNGSISRGISFGNNQDLSINSTLNLELSGEIAPNLKIMASVSDDNLPIQAQGNTSKLQEFDQVFIQVYNDNFKLIAGDFWITKPTGYFLNYKKRAQGLYGDYTWSNRAKTSWKIQGSGALSKGKFARQIIQGVEGNQGPYRLRGNENEAFIVVLSGTERVYIDGKLLNRGQEFDYIIDYNTAEVIFTAKNLITKDSRLVVEFQYSDLNYARSLVQAGTSYTSEKLDFWFNTYSEQDAKNQTIQQELSFSQKKLLSTIGDSLHLAQTQSIDSVGFLENQNLYKLIDSSGFDSILVFSVNQDSALFKATFTFVGANQGNYIFSHSNALGKIFKWVFPINGVPQGDYEAARLIITPKQKKFVSTGFSYKIGKNFRIESEVAYSVNDLNTFSKLNANDDEGFANRTKLTSSLPFFKKDSLYQWFYKTKTEIEVLSANFSPIEQYRAVEFDRDWNTRNKRLTGNQVSSSFSNEFEHRTNGNLGLELAQYTFGSDYEGYKSRLYGRWKKKGFHATWDGSYLLSSLKQVDNVTEISSTQNNDFLRHKVFISQELKAVKFAYKDDFERNNYRKNGLLETQSYLFYDKEFSVSNIDSAKVNYKLFYRERLDQRSDSSRLKNAAKAKNLGVNLNINTSVNQRLDLVVNYRQLEIKDTKLIQQTPENTLLGRIDFDKKIWKGTVNWNTFYEIGSGLELKKEFLYIQVNDGQGIYTWIDYNADGIKDLNEFEIAQYVDQASFIRVFTPSNEYVKTFSNEFNQGLFLKPERIWSSKTGILKLLSRFSDQARVRINRKTNNFKSNEVFNPFYGNVRDTTLLSSNSNIHNTLYFNRTNSIFSMDYSYQNSLSKSLLASGFDAREQIYHEFNFRWNIKKKYSIESSSQFGNKTVNADYTTGRNYDLNYFLIKPSFIIQPSTSFRFSIDSRYTEKKNVAGETSFVNELGFQMKYNQANKGSFQSAFSYLSIKYNGAENSALGFEMLESLKPGDNFKWNASYQRSVSKNLQISIQYNGRKSENNKIIHSGGMEVRAFF